MKRTFWSMFPVATIVIASVAVRAGAHPGVHHDIDALTERLQRTPDRAALLLERGRLYRLDDNPTAALADLERARTLAPADDLILLELGLTLSALGRYADAEVRLSLYIQRGGEAPDAHAERARIRARDGRVRLAVADYSAAVDRGGDIDHYLARGLLQEGLGLFDEASAGYRDGLDRTRGAVALRLALIRVQVVRGRHDEALTLIDQVMPQARVKTRWYMRRADVLEAAGHTDRARAELRRALTEADRVLARRATAINLVARAEVYVAMDRLDDARADLSTAIEKAPRYDAARALLQEVERLRRTTPGGDN